LAAEKYNKGEYEKPEHRPLLHVALYCEILPIMGSPEAKPKFHSFGNFFSETGGG